MHNRPAELDPLASQVDWRTRNNGANNWRKVIKALTTLAAAAFLIIAVIHTQRALANSDDAGSLRKILTSITETPLTDAPFIALKSSGLLAAPVESRGTLSFSASGLIEKHTTSPIDERTIITEEAIRIERDGQEVDERRFSENPALTAYAQGMRAILGGDAAPLHEHFSLTLDGDLQQWRLTLQPKSVRLQTVISNLMVTGAYGQIKTIKTVEASGDVDTLTILVSAPAPSPATRNQ